MRPCVPKTLRPVETSDQARARRGGGSATQEDSSCLAPTSSATRDGVHASKTSRRPMSWSKRAVRQASPRFVRVKIRLHRTDNSDQSCCSMKQALAKSRLRLQRSASRL